MRTDVKVGVVLSLVVVVIAGWYYLGNDPEEQSIPLAKDTTPPQAAPPESQADVPRVVRREPPVTPLAESVDTGDEVGRDVPAPLFEGLLAQDEDEEVPAETPLAELLARGNDLEEPSERADARADQDPPDKPTPAPAEQRPTAKRARRARTADAKPASHKVPKHGGRTHVVGAGDTVAILAEVYYGSQRHTGFLLRANPQVDPKNLSVGTVLRIPPLGQAADGRTVTTGVPPAPAAVGTYVVKSGDSFYAIARDLLGNANRWKELLDLNSELVAGDPKNLRPGQVLRLPAGSTTASR